MAALLALTGLGGLLAALIGVAEFIAAKTMFQEIESAAVGVLGLLVLALSWALSRMIALLRRIEAEREREERSREPDGRA